jgi:hypothetical protein
MALQDSKKSPKKRGNGTIRDQARGFNTSDIDTAKRVLDRDARDIAESIPQNPSYQKIRGIQDLLTLVQDNPYVFWYLRKLLADSAQGYLEEIGNTINSQMTDEQVSQLVRYNSGAWQALLMVFYNLEPANLERQLVELSGTQLRKTLD